MKKSTILLLFSIVLFSCQSKTDNQKASSVKTTIAKNNTLQENQLYTNSSSNKINTMNVEILDEQDRKIMERTSPRTVERIDRQEPLTIGDIIKLSQGGVSDDTIIRYIHENKTTYNLSQSQINRLQEAGVSQRIINFMIDTGK